MKTFSIFLLCMLGLTGCQDNDLIARLPDACGHGSAGDAGSLPDMRPLPPKCAAAKGLPGENLLCVDFSSLANQPLDNPPPSQLAGWDFVTNCGGKNWEIANGKLQIKDFKDFMSSCGFLMPMLSGSDYQKYNSFTLSVIQTLNVNKVQQTAFIYLGSDVDLQQITLNTGVNPRQRNIYEIAKGALPNGGTNTYRPLFKLTSTFGPGMGYSGWQIESIAINATE